MSDAYETRLVDDGGTAYEQFAVAVTVSSFAAFLLAAGTLLNWVPIEGTVGGVPAATYFGGGVLALGICAGILGGLSRWGGVRTTPNNSPGLVVGLVQGVLWLVVAGLVANYTLGLGTIGWLVAIPVGAVAGFVTISAREDAGAMFPVAAFTCLVGAIVLTGVITPAWTWEPEAFGATIPGTLAIPLLTMYAGLLTGWASASAYEGFGTRGRQNGAFLLIALVVSLVLSVLLFLLVFVFERGVTTVIENLTVGAGTMLLLTATAVVFIAKFGHLQPATADGTDKIVSFVSLAGVVVLGLLGAGLVYAIGTGWTISGYAVTIEPIAVAGAIPGVIAGVLLLFVVRQSRTPWTPTTETGQNVDRGLQIGLLILGGLTLVEVILAGILPVLAVPVIGFLVGTLGLALVVMSRVSGRSDTDTPTWLPPMTHSIGVTLWAFVLVSLHVKVTGSTLGTDQLGIVAAGTIDWPFVMNPSQGLGIQKGVMPAMFGTIWIVLGAVTFAVPFAVGAAVYLTEYADDSMFTQAVDIATNGLWSTPSIVFGLFGLAFLVPRFGGSPSIFAAQLVLGFMLLPLVLITSREAMKSVPDEYRDASAALGVSKWETIRSVVVPAAMPGVITGVILGVGRIAGETAPLLLVLNGPNFPNAGPEVLSSFTYYIGPQPPFIHVSNPALLERASALPYQLYAVITAGVGANEAFGWATALVLLGVVLAFFAIGILSRRYFRRKLHQ